MSLSEIGADSQNEIRLKESSVLSETMDIVRLTDSNAKLVLK